MSTAIIDFGMIEEGDRILCAVSGGKDSYAMHDLLVDLAKRSPMRFSLVAVNVDQGHPGYPGHLLTAYMREQGHEFRMVAEDTYSIVTSTIPEGKTYCSLCSRLRRGILYRIAQEMGCTKIALGHHREDALATLLMNLFFAGSLKSMPPKLHADDGTNVVIRPLVYCAEDDIAAYAAERAFPILPCDLCGSQEQLQRKRMNRLLDDMERDHPGTKASMLGALGNVRPSQLFDRGLWSALGLPVAAGVAPARDTSRGPADHGAADLVPLARLVRTGRAGAA